MSRRALIQLLYKTLLSQTTLVDNQPALKAVIKKPAALSHLIGRSAWYLPGQIKYKEATKQAFRLKYASEQEIYKAVELSFLAIRTLSAANTWKLSNVTVQQILSREEYWYKPSSTIGAGTLLVAHPLMTNDDYPFNHSVILICSHDNQGTTGIIINKTLNRKISRNFSELHENDSVRKRLFHGGPVDGEEYMKDFVNALQNALKPHDKIIYSRSTNEKIDYSKSFSVLHTFGEIKNSGYEVAPGLYWKILENSQDIRELVDLYATNRREFRIFYGVSKWTGGQLQREINEGSWILSNASNEAILPAFTEENQELYTSFGRLYWCNVLNLMGKWNPEYAAFADAVVPKDGHPKSKTIKIYTK